MKHKTLKTQKVYSVLELNESVREVLKSTFSGYIWVCGEIQDYNNKKYKKHIFFNLVQKDAESEAITAQVTAVIFENTKAIINKRLADAGFELHDDIEVKFLCKVDFYPKSGRFQLIVADIDPTHTLGKIAQNRQKIIEDLKKRGLIDKNKLTTQLPPLPLRLGLITSFDSAAYHDFTNELKLSGYGFKVLVGDSHMQGELVEADVLRAMNVFNTTLKNEVDVIIITRGGGSTADLSWFDNKKIAESIAASKLSVISALGHEINITVTDIVAHTSCKTPTKSAQFLIARVEEFIERLKDTQENILTLAQDLIADKKGDLNNQLLKMDAALPRFFRDHREELIDKKHTIINQAKTLIKDREQLLTQHLKDLNNYLSLVFKDSKDNLTHIDERIKLLNPKNVLKRGYSITYKGKKALKSAKEIKEGDLINTVLYDGGVISKVKEKEKKNG